MKRLAILNMIVLAALVTPAWAELGVDWTQATAAADLPARFGHTPVAHDGKIWVLRGGSGVNRVWTVWTREFMMDMHMKTTRYFEEQVLRKRPFIKREWCQRALEQPVRREQQPDGRIRHWVFVEELDRYLRVVTLADGETVLNAFPDRAFKES